MLNIVAVRGHLSRPAEERFVGKSGARVLGLELTVRREGASRADSVPVVWHDAPPAAAELAAGDEVVVVGHVARRFFRAGGATQSRTEVVAEVVVPARKSRGVKAALDRVVAELAPGGGK
ncbi:MAG: hypothetical protein KY439_11885 [Actinobacteria bacterium]|nr:hypothetical protein [Actinomycetota bacterium]